MITTSKQIFTRYEDKEIFFLQLCSKFVFGEIFLRPLTGQGVIDF